MQYSAYGLVGVLLGSFAQATVATDLENSAVTPKASVERSSPVTATTPGYKSLRYDEDYRYLKDRTKNSDFWDPVKYVQLGQSDWYLTFGGEFRERFESYSAANFGVPGRDADSYLLQRVLLHADVHAGNNVRSFVQLGHHLAARQRATVPPYSDRLDVQQAFVDFRFPLVGDTTVRIGRQEMAFGSQRLVSIRDAPNVRRSFDGVRMSASINQTHVDVFATRPVLLREASFNDTSNNAQAFWGVYAVAQPSFIPKSGIDVYYLGFANDLARYSVGTGAERRHSIGTRIFGHNKRWDWDWEALVQFGTFSQQDIRAWGFALDTGFSSPQLASRPRVGLKLTAGSGDRNPNDKRLGTYGPLFPKLAYFNQAGLVGASNVIDVQPSMAFNPDSNIKITVACDFISRQTIHDAVYTSVGRPIAGTAGHSGRYSGTEPSLDFTWRINRHLFVNTGLVYVDVAKALAEVGGHNTKFVYVSAAYTF
jgi:hypothetical protein